MLTLFGSKGSGSAAVEMAGLRHPASSLLPPDAAARAQAVRGLVFIAANCNAAIGLIDYPERWCQDADEHGHEQLRQGARARLHGCWSIFAGEFATAQPFLGGAAPGALDLLAAVVARWSGTRAHLLAQRPALLALLQRVESQPDLAPVSARYWPA